MRDSTTFVDRSRVPEATERPRAAASAVAGLALLALLGAGACGTEPESRPAGDVIRDTLPAARTPAQPRRFVIDTLAAGERLRPAGLTDPVSLWGIERGQIARLDLGTGRLDRFGSTAWDVTTGAGVVAWRNEEGVWLQRDGRAATLVAGSDPVGEFDGPPAVLFAPHGRSALLSWQAEWALHHELLAPDGSRRALAVAIPGYMAITPQLWLDSARILFSAVATGPVGGDPEYRESGWRADLAVLDLRDGTLQRVTDVADGTYLRVRGAYRGQVLVAEFAGDTLRGHWLFEPRRWTREPLALPPGRAFANGDLVIVFRTDDAGAATTGEAVVSAALVRPDGNVALGRLPDPDRAPAFSSDGRTAVLRIGPAGAERLVRIATH